LYVERAAGENSAACKSIRGEAVDTDCKPLLITAQRNVRRPTTAAAVAGLIQFGKDVMSDWPQMATDPGYSASIPQTLKTR
jgi:hypothetical protein